MAAELIARGKQEYAAGRQQQAYQALRAAWAVDESPKVACLLGQVEVDLQKHREAAEHLTVCAQHYPLPQQGLVDLERAKGHLATLVVSAPTGAKVRVDAVTIGVAPLSRPVFVEAGEHELMVHLDGYATHTEVLHTSAGDSLEKRVDLEPLPANPPAPRPALPGATREPHDSTTAGPSVKILTLIAGGVLSLGFVVTGVVYRVNAESREDDRQRLRSQLDSDSGCSNSASLLCQELSQAQQDAIDFTNTSNAMLGIGAGFAALTLGAYFLWPDSKPAKLQGQPWVGVAIGPRGVMARGEF